MGKQLISKRDTTVNLYVLDNGHGLFESVMSDIGHLIQLEMEIDPGTGIIVRAKGRMVVGPFAVCRVVERHAARLAGLKIEKGIMKRIAERLGGSEGCVHLRELAYGTINFAANSMLGLESGFSLVHPSFSRKDPETRFAYSVDLLRDSCYAYSYPYREHRRLLEAYKKERAEEAGDQDGD